MSEFDKYLTMLGGRVNRPNPAARSVPKKVRKQQESLYKLGHVACSQCKKVLARKNNRKKPNSFCNAECQHAFYRAHRDYCAPTRSVEATP